MIGDKKLLKSIRLRNFLSFGDSAEEIGLEGLNVLIGPNASGKSNFIDAIDFLRATPKDLTVPILTGGGVSDWLWKGAARIPTAELNAVLYYPKGKRGLRHRVSFTMIGQRFQLQDEAVENEKPEHPNQIDVRFYYRIEHGEPWISVLAEDENVPGQRQNRKLRREDLALDQSVLSQRKDPDQYPELTYLGNMYAKIKIYRDWNFGRYTDPRLPQKTDLPGDFLAENASNLAMVLNHLEQRQSVKNLLLDKLKQFHAKFTDIYTRIEGGTMQIFLHEDGLEQPIPATRLSDGTLQYLCLLSILCHPEPPPLICIEEPEIGLHPDVIPVIADLLIRAAEKTQLIVSTHSDILIDALSEEPEAVLVCEKEAGSTMMRRLDKEKLSNWLEKYRLGELWRRGEIGGNRW